MSVAPEVLRAIDLYFGVRDRKLAGELIAGGNFTTAGGINAKNIARWNGTIWKPSGMGMSSPGTSYGPVYELSVYHSLREPGPGTIFANYHVVAEP